MSAKSFRAFLPLHRLFPLLLALAPAIASAQTEHWVITTNPSGPGSLTAALQAVAGATSPQVIRFGFSVTSPVGASNVISLSEPLPPLDGVDLRIDGSDISPGVIIDGNGHPIFTLPVTANTTQLALSHLTLRRGGRIGRGGCVALERPAASVRIEHVDFFDCTAYLDAGAPARGGALFSGGALQLTDAVFRGNRILNLAGGDGSRDAAGGAVALEGSGAVSISRVLFEANRIYLVNRLPSFCASGHGGALSLALGNDVPVEVSGSSFIGNHTACRHPDFPGDALGTGDGGGVVVYGRAAYAFRANFFSDNIGNRGGGIGVDQAQFSTLLFANNTFIGNRANASGGGLAVINCCETRLHHNTFVDNIGLSTNFGSQFAIVGSFPASVRYNALSGSTPTCTWSFINSVGVVDLNAYSDGGCAFAGETAALVDQGPLPYAAPAMLGGDVLSMAPVFGSAMIDAGPDDAACAESVDVRGIVRPLDGDIDGAPSCDIGAVESSFVPPLPQQIFADGFETGEN